MITTSKNLCLLSHSDLFYLAVDIIWHSIVVCWVNCFHDVSPYLTHSLDVSLILFVLSDKFDFSMHNTKHKYEILTVVVITVECGVRHSFQNHQLLRRYLLRINEFSW